jgi:hypothetical protein
MSDKYTAHLFDSFGKSDSLGDYDDPESAILSILCMSREDDALHNSFFITFDGKIVFTITGTASSQDVTEWSEFVCVHTGERIVRHVLTCYELYDDGSYKNTVIRGWLADGKLLRITDADCASVCDTND